MANWLNFSYTSTHWRRLRRLSKPFICHQYKLDLLLSVEPGWNYWILAVGASGAIRLAAGGSVLNLNLLDV